MANVFSESRFKKMFSIPLRIASLYFVVGALWISLSDKILGLLIRDPEIMTNVSIVKGWCYVLVTTLMLYGLISRGISQIEDSEKKARLTNAKYRELVESANSIIMRRDITGHITFFNEFAQDFFGYSKEEILGRNVVGTIVPEVDRSGRDLKEMIEDIGKHPERYTNNENENMRANGERVWIAWTNKPIRDENGQIIEVLCIGNDISKRKLAEEELRRSNAFLDAIIENTPHAMWISDNKGTLIRLNQALRDLFKITDDDVVGKYNLLQDNLVEEQGCMPLVKEVFEKGKTVKFTLDYNSSLVKRLDLAQPVHVILDVIISPVLDADRRVTNAIIQEVDITDRKQAEEVLREKEAQLRQIIDLVPHMIFVKNWDGKYLLVNQAVADGYSTTVSDLTGKCHSDFHSSEHELQQMLKDDREVMMSGTTKFIPEETYTDARGISRFLQTTKVPFKVIGEKTSAVLGIAIDITERKLAEDERARLATAFEQVGEGIIITDTNWIIQYSNPAFERITGYDRHEIIGRHARIFRSDKHDSNFYKQLRETLSRGDLWSGRLVNKKKDGTLYDAEVTVSAVRDGSGAIINNVSIHRDVTHEVQLQRELHQAQRMEAIGLLAGGVAHDFNNILAAIMGFTELSLLKIPEDSQIRRNLEQILKAALRASDVVKQILTFTRHGVQEKKPIRIAPIVEEVVTLLRSSLPSTIEIRKEMEVTPGNDIVLGDPGQMHQLLMNLCTNAGHAMRKEGGTLTIRLSVVNDASLRQVCPNLKAGSAACITVSDTGFGINREVLERIFDPYFTTKGPGEGTGLGLSVVQGIVRKHNGAITVRSEPGQGTTFFVFLPRIESVDAKDTKALKDIATGSERILLVDDEEALVDLGKSILEMLGYRVTATTSSLEAQAIFLARPYAFDLVITDMTMPFFNGRELAEEIIAIRSDMPVILSTGFSDLINETQAKEAGVREFVMKPYEIRTLAVAIRKALGQR